MASPRQLGACTSVGAGVTVDGALYVENRGQIAVADGVYLRSLPAVSHMVTGPTGHLYIGRNVRIDHGAAIACHESVLIGDDARIGPFVMIMDTDFHEAGKHDSTGSTGAIVIGAGARLGARVTVLRGSSIGAGAIVEAGSVVKGDVRPGARVAGNPARPIGARAESQSREISLDAVLDVVAHTFGLSVPPAGSTPRDAIAAWDSLGMLNLLLSLEQSFAVTLPSEAMAHVACVADLLSVLELAADAV
jgi:acetyltransferase-like isoleucine patch superfamily enzyme/acyl carrier protein